MTEFSSASQDLSRAPLLLRGQNRLRLIGLFFTIVFIIIGLQLAHLALLQDHNMVAKANRPSPEQRLIKPDIVDRNGRIFATDIAVSSLFADPRKIIDVDEAVESLTAVLPELNAKGLRTRLKQNSRGFVWLKRQMGPQEREAVYNLGLPGIGFVDERKRVYPQGRLGAHVVGFVDVDSRGIAGMEKFLDDQGVLYTAALPDKENAGMSTDATPTPVQLSIDARVQHALSDELAHAIAKFRAKAGGVVVLNIHTGEVLGLVSLPDFNPNMDVKNTSKAQNNMMISGVYELGSVIKAVTFAMAFDYGVMKMGDQYDVRMPLVIGNARINDYHAQRRILSVPEVFFHSSNIGTAKMALQVGEEKHQEFLRKIGFFDRLKTELPESARPLLPRNWSRLATATAAFGHGFAVQPLQGLSVVASLVNGGILIPPTFLKRSVNDAQIFGKRIIKSTTSDNLRTLFRQNVIKGTASKADAIGYRVGGKTGTAEKVVNGRYVSDRNLNSFIGAFPMENPQYGILLMLDEPQATSETHGFTTAGWNAVPTAGKMIERVAPLLAIEPVLNDEDRKKLGARKNQIKKDG